ncbi:MAG: hypothetical protein HQ582_25385 [Planctomycetes bacterium]|nr:hypothetical protein [Planctomycetota bacterium]
MDVSTLSKTSSPDQAPRCSDLPDWARWHKSAPASIRKAFRQGKPSKVWSAWTRHLAKRNRPLSLSDLLPGETSPLAWCLPDGAENDGVVDLIERLGRHDIPGLPHELPPDQLAVAWLADAASAAGGPSYALEALAWCHALPRWVENLPPDLWGDLLEHLLDAVARAEQISLDGDPLVHQLLAGELPLALRHVFPELTACRRLGRDARSALSAGLVDLLDGEGLPHAERLDLMRPLLACWTRCRAVGNELTKGPWNERAQIQYEWLIRGALRLTRHDGAHVLSRGPSGTWCEELFAAAVHFDEDRDDEAIAGLVLPNRSKSDRARSAGRPLPDAAAHSEWAAVAVLRPDWSPDAPRLSVTYAGQSVQLELECERDVLWSGLWDLEVRRDGEVLLPDSDWESLCWLSDKDVDYLELGITLQGGVRVQRHVLLAREDRVLLLADAVLGDRRAQLAYRGSLPLVDGVSYQPADESREGFLVGRGRSALVLPLALSEWRTGARCDSLDSTPGGLELRQQAEGCSLFAPLLFDLKPRRMTRRLTWRQLTVAENLEIQPHDVAVGYRVAIGNQQWLLYRSLARPANRTVLGHNLATEMLMARFDRKGNVTPLAEIE